MILKVNNVSKSFKQGSTTIHALKDISFQLKKLQTLSIVGPSGSGKTTLLSLLAGLDTPTTGQIMINDSTISDMNERELAQFRAKNIGIVFQQFHLMPHLTALENVSLPLEIQGKPNVKKEARAILEMVGLSERQDHLPYQLSGGESQRVAIARASVMRPQLLLADEPSGNLDTDTGQKVMDLLFDLANEAEMTLILITHDLRLARRCTQSIHLVGGKLQ